MHLPDPKHRLQFPGLPGVFGWICIEGEPLEVYDATEDESRTVAYVESKDDVKFSVHFLDTRKKAPEDPFVVLIDVDGAKANAMAFPIADNDWDGNLDDSFPGFTKFRPFVFRKLFTTDQAQEACNDRDFVDNLGTIQLKICRIEHVRRIATCYKAKAPEGRIVDEQKKKARLTHQVAFGDTVDSRDGDAVDASTSTSLKTPSPASSSVTGQSIEGHAPDPDADKKAERAKERHSPSPRLSADTDDSLPPQVARRQLADKRAELEMLEIEKRIAKVKREILVLEGGEEVDDPKRKRVKFEEGVKDESEAVGDGKKESKEMGKGGKKVTVIDLD